MCWLVTLHFLFNKLIEGASQCLHFGFYFAIFIGGGKCCSFHFNLDWHCIYWIFFGESSPVFGDTRWQKPTDTIGSRASIEKIRRRPFPVLSAPSRNVKRFFTFRKVIERVVWRTHIFQTLAWWRSIHYSVGRIVLNGDRTLMWALLYKWCIIHVRKVRHRVLVSFSSWTLSMLWEIRIIIRSHPQRGSRSRQRWIFRTWAERKLLVGVLSALCRNKCKSVLWNVRLRVYLYVWCFIVKLLLDMLWYNVELIFSEAVSHLETLLEGIWRLWCLWLLVH